LKNRCVFVHSYGRKGARHDKPRNKSSFLEDRVWSQSQPRHQPQHQPQPFRPFRPFRPFLGWSGKLAGGGPWPLTSQQYTMQWMASKCLASSKLEKKNKNKKKNKKKRSKSHSKQCTFHGPKAVRTMQLLDTWVKQHGHSIMTRFLM